MDTSLPACRTPPAAYRSVEGEDRRLTRDACAARGASPNAAAPNKRAASVFASLLSTSVKMCAMSWRGMLRARASEEVCVGLPAPGGEPPPPPPPADMNAPCCRRNAACDACGVAAVAAWAALLARARCSTAAARSFARAAVAKRGDAGAVRTRTLPAASLASSPADAAAESANVRSGSALLESIATTPAR